MLVFFVYQESTDTLRKKKRFNFVAQHTLDLCLFLNIKFVYF